MKSNLSSITKSSLVSPAAYLIGGVLLLTSSFAGARDFAHPAAAAGFVGYRAGVRSDYNSGYGYGYTAPATAAPTATGSNAATALPPGYVTTLPSDTAPVLVFGKTYYFSSGNYYSPICYAGRTGYMPANP